MILESECDFATIHNVIVKSLERNNNYNFPIERLIRLADTLLQQVPIDSLPMKCDRELHWLIRTNR